MEKIAENIKKLRKQHHLSQQELADKIFVSHQTISGWESGRTDPDVDSIQKLAEIFCVSVEYLIAGEDNVKEVVVEKEVPVEKVVEKEVIKEVPVETKYWELRRASYLVVFIGGFVFLFALIIGCVICAILKDAEVAALLLVMLIIIPPLMILFGWSGYKNAKSKLKGDKKDEQK